MEWRVKRGSHTEAFRQKQRQDAKDAARLRDQSVNKYACFGTPHPGCGGRCPLCEECGCVYNQELGTTYDVFGDIVILEESSE